MRHSGSQRQTMSKRRSSSPQPITDQRHSGSNQQTMSERRSRPPRSYSSYDRIHHNRSQTSGILVHNDKPSQPRSSSPQQITDQWRSGSHRQTMSKRRSRPPQQIISQLRSSSPQQITDQRYSGSHQQTMSKRRSRPPQQIITQLRSSSPQQITDQRHSGSHRQTMSKRRSSSPQQIAATSALLPQCQPAGASYTFPSFRRRRQTPSPARCVSLPTASATFGKRSSFLKPPNSSFVCIHAGADHPRTCSSASTAARSSGDSAVISRPTAGLL